MWTGRNVSPKTCRHRRHTPRSGPCPSRKSRSGWRRLGSPGWTAGVHPRASCRESRSPEAEGQGLSEGKAPGRRPRRKLAPRAWWCRLRSQARNALAVTSADAVTGAKRDTPVSRVAVESRLSSGCRVGPGRGAPPLAHWPRGRERRPRHLDRAGWGRGGNLSVAYGR